jgi:4a-hydroxytetrahydrobiopterin dehydratase
MKLSDSEIKGKLGTVQGWQLAKGKLHKEFKFENFEQAMKFINEVAAVAGSLDHHPEIYNVYNRVVLDINTHDEGGITELDFAFAKRIDTIKQ